MTLPVRGAALVPPLDEASRLAADVICVGCGYNLRGLRPEDVCPECATPVSRSTAGNLLRFAPPNWLRSVASGVGWMLLGGLISALVRHGPMLAYFAGWPWTLSPRWFQWGFFAGGLLAFVGYWRATELEPADSGEEITSRQVARWAAVVKLVCWIGASALWGRASLPPAAGLTYVILHTGVAVTLYFSAGRYACSLALRVPDSKLARRMQLMAWLLATATIVEGSLNLFMWLGSLRFASLVTGPWMYLWQAVGLATLLLNVCAFFWLLSFRRTVGRCAMLARG